MKRRTVATARDYPNSLQTGERLSHLLTRQVFNHNPCLMSRNNLQNVIIFFSQEGAPEEFYEIHTTKYYIRTIKITEIVQRKHDGSIPYCKDFQIQ
jgi:hypothetical protein